MSRRPSSTGSSFPTLVSLRGAPVTRRAAGFVAERGDAAKAAAERQPLRIMIADDNRTSLALLEGVLRTAGHVPEAVSSGDAVLDRPLEGDVMDALVVGMSISAAEAIDAIRMIRFAEIGTGARRRLPIAALLPDKCPEYTRLSEAAGMDLLMIRPVSPQGLLDGLQSLVARRHSEAGRPSGFATHPERLAEYPSPQEVGEGLYQLGGSPLIQSIADSFLADADAILSLMGEALRSRDGDLFRQQLTQAETTLATLGSPDLVRSYRLPEAIHGGRLQSVGPLILQAVKREMVTLMNRLERYQAPERAPLGHIKTWQT